MTLSKCVRVQVRKEKMEKRWRLAVREKLAMSLGCSSIGNLTVVAFQVWNIPECFELVKTVKSFQI